MQAIKDYFKKYVGISEEDFQLFSSKLIRKSFKKGEIILENGQVETYLSFLSDGIVRFNIPKEDHDLTFGFIFTGNFFSAYDSFLTQTPVSYNTEAITNCIIYQISRDDLEQVYAETKVGNKMGRLAAEQLFLFKMRRELSLLDETATERYLKLFNERPELIRKIPQKYIASYIGVRPQSLSRIRRSIS